MTIEAWYPQANKEILLTAEEFFANRLRGNPNIEAITMFASALKNLWPKDIDFFVVSDDPRGINAENWISTLRLDFFYRIGTTLDPHTIHLHPDTPIRRYNAQILEDLKKGGECVVFTQSAQVSKYHSVFPKSNVLIVG